MDDRLPELDVFHCLFFVNFENFENFAFNVFGCGSAALCTGELTRPALW
jgi:hypothetical protein